MRLRTEARSVHLGPIHVLPCIFPCYRESLWVRWVCRIHCPTKLAAARRPFIFGPTGFESLRRGSSPRRRARAPPAGPRSGWTPAAGRGPEGNLVGSAKQHLWKHGGLIVFVRALGLGILPLHGKSPITIGAQWSTSALKKWTPEGLGLVLTCGLGATIRARTEPDLRALG